ncbi:hypothetical protein JW960_21620 [candidate division KSB1 bacterium]|nr:hypothetical protein [candidate division KSB1 bacterium]
MDYLAGREKEFYKIWYKNAGKWIVTAFDNTLLEWNKGTSFSGLSFKPKGRIRACDRIVKSIVDFVTKYYGSWANDNLDNEIKTEYSAQRLSERITYFEKVLGEKTPNEIKNISTYIPKVNKTDFHKGAKSLKKVIREIVTILKSNTINETNERLFDFVSKFTNELDNEKRNCHFPTIQVVVKKVKFHRAAETVRDIYNKN